MDKVVYISLEYINMHLLYIMRVLIFMDPDKGCKRSFIWGRKGCAWETNAKNKKLSKLTYLTLLQYLTNNWLAITSCFSIIYLYGKYLKFICSKIPRKSKQVWTFMNIFIGLIEAALTRCFDLYLIRSQILISKEVG